MNNGSLDETVRTVFWRFRFAGLMVGNTLHDEHCYIRVQAAMVGTRGLLVVG